MFKRLREGLFKRTEESSQEIAESQPDELAEDTWTASVEEAQETAGDEEALAEESGVASSNGVVVAAPEVVPVAEPAKVVPVAEPPMAAPVVPVDTRVEPALASYAEPDEAWADESIDAVTDATPAEERTGKGFWTNPFRFSLGRTRQLFGRVNEALEHDDISDELWDELEETLIGGDVGVQTTDALMQTLRQRVEAEHLTRGRELRDALKEELELMLGDPEPMVFSETSPISVYLVVGVNGVGKTTSIAKLAQMLKRSKHRVLLAAGDTFRAAATEQIKAWGERVGVTVISHQHGADPGAVVYDAMQAAQARGTD